MTKVQDKKQSVIIFRTPTKTKVSIVKKLKKAGVDMSTLLNLYLKNLDRMDKISIGVYGMILDEKTGRVAHKNVEDMWDYIDKHDE